MASRSQSPKGHDGALSTLDVLIQVLSLAKDTCGIPPAQIALASAVVLLTMIRVRFPLLGVDESRQLSSYRTRSPTIRTTLTSDELAVKYVKR